MQNKGRLSFRKKGFKKEESLEERQKEAVEVMKATKQAARKCLNNTDFKKYKEQYEKALQATTDLIFLIHGKANSVEDFGFRVYGIISELKCLRALLKTVEIEAKENAEI